MEKEYKIGDKVWWATCDTLQVKVDCPICFKKGKVTLILGNGESVETPCDYCMKGFEYPVGYTNEWQRISGVKEIAITGKEITENEKGRKVEYRYSGEGHNYCLYNDSIFDTKEEAENRVKEIIAEHEAQELLRLAHKKKSNQTHYSWSVGYYKKQIKDAQKNLDYYSRKIKELGNEKVQEKPN